MDGLLMDEQERQRILQIQQQTLQNISATETMEESLQRMQMSFETKGNITRLKDNNEKPSFFSKVKGAFGKSGDVRTQEELHRNRVEKITGQDAMENRSTQMHRAKIYELAVLSDNYSKQEFATPDFCQVMEKVRTYVTAKTFDDQQTAVYELVESIKAYLVKAADATEANEVLMRDQMKTLAVYFDIGLNGSLRIPANVSRTPVADPKKRWVSKYTNRRKQSLFPHEPNAADVQQRLTQDCYMMSSLSSIAYSNPQAIREAMRDNGDGTVTVRFYEPAPLKSFLAEQSAKDILAGYAEMTEEQKNLAKRRVLKKFLSGKLRDNEEDEDADGAIERNAVDINILSGNLTSNNEAWYDNVAERSLEDPATAALMNALFDKILERALQQNDNDDFGEDLGGDDAMDAAMEVLRTWKGSDAIMDLTHLLNDQTLGARTINVATYVTVTKEVPSVMGADMYAANSLWVQMIEKAYAAKFGNRNGKRGYEGIALGTSFEFLERFLNQQYRSDGDNRIIGNPPTGADAFSGVYTPQAVAVYQDMQTRLERGEVLTVGCDYKEKAKISEINGRGIRNGHAYSLLGTHQQGDHYYVTLRDPYGVFKTEYKQEGEGAPVQKVNASSSPVSLSMNDSLGFFNMELNDFLATFQKYSGRLQTGQ